MGTYESAHFCLIFDLQLCCNSDQDRRRLLGRETQGYVVTHLFLDYSVANHY